MTAQQIKFQKEMQDALELYKLNTQTAKEYFTSMKEISSWLAKRDK